MRILVIVALLTACSNDSRHTGGDDADVGPLDGDADVDAFIGPGPVTVHLVDRNGTPVPGLQVYFINPDANVIDVVSDSAGLATASIEVGASVTALRPDTELYTLATVLDLVGGDDITLITAAAGASSAQDPFSVRLVPLPSADVTSAVKPSGGTSATYETVAAHGFAVGDTVQVEDVLPANVFEGTWMVTAVPTATSFTVTLTTGGGQQTSASGGTAHELEPYTVTYSAYGGATSYEIHTPCGPTNVGNVTTATVYLRAGCATSSMTVLVFAKSNATTELAYTTQDVTFASGGSTMIADTWHALVPVTATYTTPGTVTNISVARYTPYLRGGASSSASAAATNPTTLMLTTATTVSAWMRSTFAGDGQQFLTEQVDGTTTTYTADVSAALLPWIGATYNPTTTTIDVSVTGSASYDLFHASLKYIRGQVIYSWQLFGPVAQDTKFPTLPAGAPGDPTVRETDTQSSYRADICDSDAIAGYRAAIRKPFESFGACEQPALVDTKSFAAVGTRNRLSQSN